MYHTHKENPKEPLKYDILWDSRHVECVIKIQKVK